MIAISFSLCLVLAVGIAGYPSCDVDDRYSYSDSEGGLSWYGGEISHKRKPCQSQQTNMRGYYSAKLAPCKIQYHNYSGTNDETIDAHEVSAVCSGENLAAGEQESSRNTLYEYLHSWNDECVGDFRRCYIIPRDEKIFKPLFCHKKWQVPDGTTHISVDCTEDKAMKKQLEETLNPDQKQQLDKMREMETILFVILAILLVLFCTCSALTYRWVVRPYQQNLNLRLMEHRALLNHKKHDKDEVPMEETIGSWSGV